MSKTVIVYGSSTGTCEDIARRIATQLGLEKKDVVDASALTAEQVSECDNLILGTSTWGEGDIQDDWYDGLKVIQGCDLTGKDIALFGCGDSGSFSDTFCGGMAQLWEGVKDRGANLIGQVSTDSYTFDDSEAVVDGKFIGLALDEVNEADKTDERIAGWMEQIKKLLK
jgi:flavodoxin I